MIEPLHPSQPDDLEERQLRRVMIARRFFIAIATLTAVMMLGSATYVAFAIRATQVGNTSTLRSASDAANSAKDAAESAERGTARIEDCTTPGRDCYDSGQKRTADAIADINKVAVYAAACADQDGVQGEDEIYTCVIRLLAADD